MFDRIAALANRTALDVLAEAWGTCQDEARSGARGERPMTIREAGALADLHGMTLLDVLPV